MRTFTLLLLGLFSACRPVPTIRHASEQPRIDCQLVAAVLAEYRKSQGCCTDDLRVAVVRVGSKGLEDVEIGRRDCPGGPTVARMDDISKEERVHELLLRDQPSPREVRFTIMAVRLMACRGETDCITGTSCSVDEVASLGPDGWSVKVVPLP